MSTVIILAPVIVASWPAITAAVAAAAAGLGFNITEKIMEDCRQKVDTAAGQTVEVELENSEVLSSGVASGKEIVLNQGDVTLRVTRDARGRCKVCAEGKGVSKVELKRMAEEFTQKLTQCFIYHQTVSELKSKNFQMVNEEVTEDGAIRIHVRRWVD